MASAPTGKTTYTPAATSTVAHAIDTSASSEFWQLVNATTHSFVVYEGIPHHLMLQLQQHRGGVIDSQIMLQLQGYPRRAATG